MSIIPEDFRKFLHEFSDNWRSIDIRAIAKKIEIGWVFHSLKITFDPDLENKSLQEDLPNIDNLLVIHERWDIDKIDQLLNYIEKGELIIGKETIHIKRFNGKNWELFSSLNHRLFDNKESYRRFKIKYPTTVLEGYDNPRTNYLEKEIIDQKLRSDKIPWDGIADLQSNFMGLGQEWVSRDTSLLYIIAPIYVELKKIELKGSKLKIEMKKPDTILCEDISLSIISYQENNIISRNKYSIKNKIIDLKHKPLMIKALVNYRNRIIESKELFGQTLNKRVNVYQEIVGDFEDFLEDFNKKSRRFEAKISILFHLLGLSPAYYGYTTQNIPDILVFSKENEFVLVVECTTREPDLNNKLTKLSTRTKEIENIIDDISVLPILVTSFNRSLINVSDIEKALKEKIALVTSNEISILISMCLEQKSPEQVYDYINSLIPYDTSFSAR